MDAVSPNPYRMMMANIGGMWRFRQVVFFYGLKWQIAGNARHFKCTAIPVSL
jgi:hypothetical protein